jgi:hypothetical protein
VTRGSTSQTASSGTAATRGAWAVSTVTPCQKATRSRTISAGWLGVG